MKSYTKQKKVVKVREKDTWLSNDVTDLTGLGSRTKSQSFNVSLKIV